MQAPQAVSGTQAVQAQYVVDVQNQTRFEFILDRLEKQVCDYISYQANTTHELRPSQIKQFFRTAKEVSKR